MADADNGKDLAVGLEVLPRGGRRSSEYKFETEASGIPRLVCKRRFLVLCVERANRGEGHRLVAVKHGGVIAEQRRRDRADREHRRSDHAACLYAHVGLHFQIQSFRVRVTEGVRSCKV